jgi:hypothetical protein
MNILQVKMWVHSLVNKQPIKIVCDLSYLLIMIKVSLLFIFLNEKNNNILVYYNNSLRENFLDEVIFTFVWKAKIKLFFLET